MTSNQPDRLDRIEITLERVSQQLDNQVAVNAELRQSTQELRQSTVVLQQSMQELRQTTSVLTDVANVLMTSVTSLTGVVNQHQENFVVVLAEIRSLREDNQRILNRIERLENQS